MTVRLLCASLLLALSFTAPSAAEPPAAPEQAAAEKPAPAKELTPNEARFEKTLSGATLVGHFTANDQKGPPREERYTISKVSKLHQDFWLFQTRIQYGEHDLTLPLPLRVLWAGDTPVITLDNVPVPGLGAFTARVVITSDKYAGTWHGGNHGGHLFGKIEPPKKSSRSPPSPNPSCP